MTSRTLVVGEALVDIVHRHNGRVDEHPGGSPANVAIGLARLGHPVDFAAHFGQDRYGQLVHNHLVREPNLHLTPGTDQADRTPTAKATIDAFGAATYEFDLAWDVADALDDAPVGHLHTGSIAATLEPGGSAVVAEARRARETGTVSYDPNARPTIMGSPAEARPRIEELIALSDVVKASDEDVDWLYDGQEVREVMQAWGRLGPSLVVVTRGHRGSTSLVVHTGEVVDLPAGKTVVVDTVGAGDSFMAGLISGLLDAGYLGSVAAREALHAAHLVDLLPALSRAGGSSAITVARAGANPPTRAELEV